MSLIYANLAAKRAAASVTGDTYTFPTFLAGKCYPISLRFLEKISGRLTETFPPILAVRATVGLVDTRPNSRTVKLQFGAGTSTGANTTAAMNWNEPASGVKAALNALTDVDPSDFEVDWDEGSYIIRRTSGEDFTLTVRENHLRPLSFVRISKKQASDGAWLAEVRFLQSPLAFSDTATPVQPPEPYFEAVADGVDYGNGLVQNEVQNLVLPPAFRGQFYIVYKKTAESSPRRTQLFTRSDGVAQYKAALDFVMSADAGVATVTNPEVGKARFEFGGDLAGADIPLLTVEVPTEGTPPGDWSFDLDLNTWECWAALRGQEEITIPLELEMDVLKNPDDEESGTKTLPVWRETITIRKPLTLEGLATAHSVDWLRKPNPKTYLPYSATQVGSGQLHYESALFGDASETHFEFDHNLAVTGLTGLQVLDTTDGRILKPSEYEAHATNAGNTLELDFDDAPAIDSLKVFVSTPQPLDFFINDLEIEISQVNGLSAIITDLTERLEVVEAVLPSTGPGATADSTTGLIIALRPSVGLLFSDAGKTLISDEGVDLDLLEEEYRPPLLPAIHDAAVDNVTAVPDDAEGNEGKVYKNNDTPDLIVAPGGGIRAATVKQNEFFGCDGEAFFKVTRDGATNSFYPAPFEKSLFVIAVNDSMLAVGRTLDVSFAVQLQLLLADCQAQWVFRLETGAAPQAATPDPVGLNLENIVWAADPIFEQRIVLDPNLQSHAFGVRIARAVGGLALDQQRYGIWSGNDDAAPATANFVLRGRLHKFDTEDNAPQSKGHLFYRLVGEINADGTIQSQTAKATIS